MENNTENDVEFEKIIYNPNLTKEEHGKLYKILLDRDITGNDWIKFSKMSREDFANLVKHSYKKGDEAEEEYMKEILNDYVDMPDIRERENRSGGKGKSRKTKKSRKTRKSRKSRKSRK